ncbi:hypothetical protein [Desulfococcus sp.]|uniref:hypothetical protein n=1 Tax=Desulfococcus sp. TaxID=2025834 RepID=UPI00359386C0
MKLFEQDANLFFELMWALQYFVNQKFKILPNIKSVDAYVECSPEEKAEVRNALYADIKLIDAFVQQNPQHFSVENLSLVSGWKNFIPGDFQIERFLKQYAVFIKGGDVFGVVGLYQGFDELVHRSHLPLHVQAVLLPFKGKIIYDGMFQTYNIHFGGGIKRRLKETYMTAKQNNRIIENLDAPPQKTATPAPAKPSKDWAPVLDELAAMAKKLRGRSGDPAIYGAAFGLAKASIEFAQQSVSDTAGPYDLHQSLRRVDRALRKTITVLNREEH